MYNEYFGLTDRPFSIAPDPRYLYMSSQHKEALAHLMYGVRQDGGFILLTGEVGTGKTTVCRCFLKQLDDKIDVAYIVNPKQTSLELLESMCDDLGIARYQDEISIKSLTDAITERLLNNHADGKNTVLLIDEAQNLSVDVLEQLRLLTNLETDQKKLLQIILLGQPELLDLLNKPELRQLSQRVTARFHMDKLDRKDIIPYVRHRLAVAGCKMVLFPEQTAKAIEKASGGVPRLINLICDRALLGVYSSNGNTVTVATLKKAAKEVLGENKASLSSRSKDPLGFSTFFESSLIAHRKNIFVLASVSVFFMALGFMLNSFVGQERASGASMAEVPVDHIDVVENGVNALKLVDSDTKSEPDTNLSTDNITTIDPSLSTVFGDNAYALLGRPWGIEALPNDWYQLCSELSETRLSCASSNLSFNRLIKLNRPVVASVIHQGRSKRILLTGIRNRSNDEAHEVVIEVLDENANKTEISISFFKAIWTGRSDYLWLEPEKDMPLLKPGDKHQYLETVREVLLGSTSVQVDEPALYDQRLFERVREFQRDSGVASDGVIGPETIMLINQRSADVPVLISVGPKKRNQESI